MRAIRLVIWASVFIASQAMAQGDIPLGAWRTHFSYYNIKHVEEAGDKIYAAAESGLYFFDKTDNSITRLSKLNGLQAESIAALRFDGNQKQLLVGYTNGNLDVIKDNTIINLDLTSTAQVITSKNINDIQVFSGDAFIATDYGMLRFSLTSLKVTETYRELGATGEPIKINDSVILNDSIYLSTQEGVIASAINTGVNLLDFRNWKRYDVNGAQSEVSNLAVINDLIIAAIDGDQLYKYDGAWSGTGLLANESFSTLTSDASGILIAHSGQLKRLKSDFSLEEINSDLLSVVNMAISDSNDKLWIADGANGLISDYQGQFESFVPDGPYTSQIFSVEEIGGDIYVFSGGYDADFKPNNSDAGYYVFSDNAWQNYNERGVDNLIPEFRDVTDGAVLKNQDAVYIASAGYGLLKISNSESQIFNAVNSPLLGAGGSDPGVIIPAIYANGNTLWVLNYGVSTPLHSLASDGTWKSYSVGLTEALYPLDLIVQGTYVWMITDPKIAGGLVIIDTESGQSRVLSEAAANGGLAGDIVNCLAIDKDGFIWVGTNKGVSVFTNPFSVLSGDVDAFEPIFENRLLFKDKNVLDITIDGGNRKWMATEDGVWLFDEEADKLLLNFNAENSPLPDNNIFDIKIDPESGEVFFASTQGIVSYRAGATEGSSVHQQVKIFPNPVTKDFEGTIGISGLASDAVVKITDTSGKLIWQTQANGATATWDGNDYNGNRAATGIYLVFSATQDGEDAFVGKIAIVN